MSARAIWAAASVFLALGAIGCARSTAPATTLHRDALRGGPGSVELRGAALESEAFGSPGAPMGSTGVLLAEAAPTPEPGDEPAEAEPTEADPEQAQQRTQAVADTPAGGPLLIYEAQVNLAVHEVREKIDQVVALTDELEGFIQAQDNVSVIIRVPSFRFRDTLERVEALGDVLHRRVSAEDMSDQVRDVRIRLENAVQMRHRLAELLERADTVPDSLTIERELERLTQSIELLRGQLRSLEDRITYSTITVRFQPVRTDQEVPRERFRLPFLWLEHLGLVNLLRL